MIAVIPTHRPTPALRDLVARLAPQVDRVVIVDDGSPCTSDRSLAESAAEGASVVRIANNLGIATALCVGLGIAASLDATWLLTVDQDGTIGSDHVVTLLRSAADAGSAGVRVGGIAPQRIRVGGQPLRYRIVTNRGQPQAAEVLQSGTMWSVEGLIAAGEPEPGLVIDGVDTAMCLGLRRHGYTIILADDMEMSHQLGNSRPVRLAGWTPLATGHAPFRRYYIVRNKLALLPQQLRDHPVSGLVAARQLAVGTVLATTVEDRRLAKLSAAGLGAWHAARRRHGTLPAGLRERWA